jgi:O-succinylbenzoic acid--CoA ligase
MAKPGLLTVTATDQLAVVSAMRLVLNGDAAIAVIPKTDSSRTSAILDAIKPDLPVSPEIGLIAVTSGSTGAPKGVAISYQAIQSSISAVNQELGATPNWHLVLPIHHIAGTMTALRGLSHDSKLHQPTINAGDPMQLAAYAKSIKDLSAAHAIALVPEHLRRLDVIDELSSLKYFFKVLVGAGALSSELKRKLEDLGINYVSSYGLTETCGGVVWNGKPLDSVSISINESGEVLIQSAMNASGYRDSKDDLSVVNTKDLGKFESGRLVITGRSDNKIKIKGHFVDLDATSKLLEEITNSEAVCLALDEGLYLIITVEALDHQTLLNKLVHELGDGLKGSKVRVWEKIPRTELGKIDMFAIRTELKND